jgi:signal transduction histidine kinase
MRLQHASLFEILFSVLLYLSIKLLFYLVDEKKYPWKKIIPIVVTVLIFWGYFVFHILLIFFLVINIWQIFYQEQHDDFNYFLLWLSLTLGLIFSNDYWKDYFFISFFVLFILTLTSYFVHKRDLYYAREKELKTDLELMKKNLVNAKQFDLSAKYQLQLEERNVLAQKLHDELGHTLSGSIMQLEALKLIMDAHPEKAKEMVTVVTENLREGTDSIREILKNTKPDLSSLNLNSIKMLTLETENASGVKIDLEYSKDINTITSAMWNVIVANIRESLTNMMRYSKATKCVIRFEKLNQLYKVSIIDNGVGKSKIMNGLGIRGMEERMHTLEGTLIVDGSDGFHVVMLFPIQ